MVPVPLGHSGGGLVPSVNFLGPLSGQGQGRLIAVANATQPIYIKLKASCALRRLICAPRTPNFPTPQVRKTYPLKCLHDMRLIRAGVGGGGGGGNSGSGARKQRDGRQPSPQRQQQQLQRLGSEGDVGWQQPMVELRLAQHHSVPEHRGQYVMHDQEQAMFVMSLAVQLLR